MPSKDPEFRQRPSNIARLDIRRGKAGAPRDEPCIPQANPYVDRASVKETNVMPSQGKPPIHIDDGFRVGDFEVHPKRLALVRDGNTTRLEPKVMAVLVQLARRADEVVTRNEFADEVWRGRIVSDEVLSRDISILRSQLGDDAKEPRYVVTIPRVGYRLIADVRPLHDPEPDAALPAPPQAESPPLAPNAVHSDGSVETVTQVPAVRGVPRDRRQAVWFGVAAVATIAIVAIWWFNRVTPPALDRTQIAVLPFVSLSESSDDEFFSDGLSEEIMHALGGISGIRVVAKTSSFAFRGSTEDVRTIGHKLNAGSLLEGSVRRDGDRLRVSAQMIDAHTGLQAWSETYDRRMDDIFEVQNQISTAIAARLVGTLSPGSLPAPPTRDIEAYTLFLRANHLLRQRGAAQLTRAVELFQGAIARDPEFARAYTGLAEAYTVQPSYTGTSEREGHRLALAAQQTAEALGEGPARLRGIRAYIHFRSRQWERAKADFDAALADGTSDPDVLQWYSQFLSSVGWTADARVAARKAVDADPLSPTANQRAGVVSLWNNDSDAAKRYFSIASEVGIDRPVLPEAQLAFLLNQGRIDEARAVLLETQRLRNQSTAWIEPALSAIAGTGSPRDAIDVLAREYHAGVLGAPMYVGALFVIGDADGLYDAMPDVVASGEPFDVEVFFSEAARPLRRDPRFIPLMTQLQLVDFWDTEHWPDMCARTADSISCG
jgi:TolB-like protein/DNA-binding winged helix-turn-helix (wHTH) protein/Tfp pilus assembly protein PilF